MDENSVALKPSVNTVDGGFIAFVTITDSEGQPIAYSDHVFAKTADEAMQLAYAMAKELSGDIMTGYEHYLQTGEEP
jgi:hypothetical protein